MSELDRLKVQDIMVPDPVTVGPDEPVQRVARLMSQHNVGSVVVVDSQGKVVGIVTDRDMARRALNRCAEWHTLKVRDIMSSPVHTVRPTDSWLAAAERMDVLHVRHLPVVENRRLVGIISARDLLQHRARFLEAAVRDRTAELEARHAELLSRNRLLDYYLRMASRIQHQLLPARLPSFEEVRLSVWYEPKERVSGDFYDLRPVDQERLSIMICDASGHGLPAAFVSVIAQAVFRTCDPATMSPAEVLEELNRYLRGMLEQERFVTACYAVLHVRSGQLRYAKAGHPPPLWYRAAHRHVATLDARGMLLGVAESASFEEVSVQLQPGDRVVFYTDGLLETWSERGELLGMGRLRRWVATYGSGSPDEILAGLKKEAEAFRGHRPWEDDITVLALAYDPRKSWTEPTLSI
jgi:sigma-B regulation protein RsbU (phosphoserine phosphatase)